LGDVEKDLAIGEAGDFVDEAGARAMALLARNASSEADIGDWGKRAAVEADGRVYGRSRGRVGFGCRNRP